MASPGRKALPAGAVVVQYNSAGRSCKPNSVVCGHSSRRRVAADAHQRPTRRFRRPADGSPCRTGVSADRSEPPGRFGPMRSGSLALGSRFPPYLVLLRVGFTLPRPLQDGRCALAAPFHPYPGAGLPQRRAHPASRTNSGIAFPGRPSTGSVKRARKRGSRGGIFSVALAVHGP